MYPKDDQGRTGQGPETDYWLDLMLDSGAQAQVHGGWWDGGWVGAPGAQPWKRNSQMPRELGVMSEYNTTQNSGQGLMGVDSGLAVCPGLGSTSAFSTSCRSRWSTLSCMYTLSTT